MVNVVGILIGNKKKVKTILYLERKPLHINNLLTTVKYTCKIVDGHFIIAEL